MAIIRRTVDRMGREVTLTDVGRAHILEKRPEMAERLEDIQVTIESPDLVTRDNNFAHRENHYRRTGPGRLALKVVVHYRPVPPQGTWAGRIITAHPTRSGIRKEKQLWP